MQTEPKLLANRIRTPDGTILQSFRRHHYVEYHDKVSNEWYSIDGGLDYVRRSVNNTPAQDMCVYTDDPHYVIREAFCWGTRGVDGDKPLTFVALSQLTTEHLQAIIRTQWHVPEYILRVLQAELNHRNNGEF